MFVNACCECLKASVNGLKPWLNAFAEAGVDEGAGADPEHAVGESGAEVEVEALVFALTEAGVDVVASKEGLSVGFVIFGFEPVAEYDGEVEEVVAIAAVVEVNGGGYGSLKDEVPAVQVAVNEAVVFGFLSEFVPAFPELLEGVFDEGSLCFCEEGPDFVAA